MVAVPAAAGRDEEACVHSKDHTPELQEMAAKISAADIVAEKL
jgi:hypothetical protein